MKRKTTIGVLTALGTIASVAAPIAATVSCGTSDEDDAKTLSFAMRTEDFSFWRPIMTAFTEKTGVNVEERLTSSQKSDYSTWSGTGSMPDIGLIDQNAAKDAIKYNEWFQPLDLNELKDAKYDISANTKDETTGEFTTGTQKEFNYLDSTKFNQPVLSPFKIDDNSAVAIPYAYSAQGLYLNPGIFGTSTTLSAWLPKKDGTFAKEEVATGLDTTDKKMAAIKEFLKNSGTTDANDGTTIVKSDSAIKTDLETKSSDTEWFDNGPYAMYQRIGSIAKSFGKTDQAAWIKDLGLPFELVAGLGDGIYKDGKLQDAVLQKRFPKTGTQEKDLIKIYESYLGYFGAPEAGNDDNRMGYAINPKTEKEPGEAETIWKGHTAVMLGFKWQAGMIQDNWTKDIADTYDNDIKILPTPYGSTNADGLGIRKDLTGDKLDIAKEFLRFVTEQGVTDNAVAITGGKTISPIVAASDKQEADVETNPDFSVNEKARQRAFFGSSTGADYEGLSGVISASSTDGIYDLYNGQYGADSGLKFTINKGTLPIGFDEWKTKFDSVLPNVFKQITIMNA